MAVLTISSGIFVGQLTAVVIFVTTCALSVIDVLRVRARSVALAAIYAHVHSFERVIGKVVVKLNPRFEHMPVVFAMAIGAFGAETTIVWIVVAIGATGKLKVGKLLELLAVARGFDVTVYTFHFAVSAFEAKVSLVVVKSRRGTPHIEVVTLSTIVFEGALMEIVMAIQASLLES